MRAGADFRELVRIFSESPTLFNNGDRGWLLADELSPELARIVQSTPVGGMVGPFPAPGGYYLVQVIGERVIGAPDSAGADIRRIRIPYGPGADGPQTRQAAIELAVTLRKTAGDCADPAAVLPALPAGVSEVRPLPRADVPATVQPLLAALKTGEVTAPVVNDAEVLLFAVCRIADAALHAVDREEVANHLWQERLGFLLRQYMRDLRQKAIIDQRI